MHTINIFGYIASSSFWGDETTPKQVQEAVDKVPEGEELLVRISSYGGEVDAGETIYSILKNSGRTVVVEIIGQAYSMASVIAMAGDTIRIAENGQLMIHNPWTYAEGNASELREKADELEKISTRLFAYYTERAPDNEEKLREYYDSEYIMDAQEAIAVGLVDEVIGASANARFYPMRAVATIKPSTKTKKENMKIDFAQLQKDLADGLARIEASLRKTGKAKAAMLETENGTLYYDGDTLEKGTAVFSDEAMTTPAADGDYVQNGITYTVADGAVSAVDTGEQTPEEKVTELEQQVQTLTTELTSAKKRETDQAKALADVRTELEKIKQLATSFGAVGGGRTTKVEDGQEATTIAAKAASVREKTRRSRNAQ